MRRRLWEQVWIGWALLANALISLSIILLLGFLLREAWPFLSSPWLKSVLSDASWHPSEQSFGILPMVLGSLAVCSMAVLQAVLLSALLAVQLSFFLAVKVASSIKLFLNLMSGIPSVVVGLWGLTILVPMASRCVSPGFGLLPASIVLSFILIPSLTLSFVSCLDQDKEEVWRVSQSLGISETTMIRHIIFPAKAKSLLHGVVIAVSRAFGETLAVLMVAGNAIHIPTSLFDSFRTLNATIALEMPYALGTHQAALFFLGLILLLSILLLRLFAWRRL